MREIESEVLRALTTDKPTTVFVGPSLIDDYGDSVYRFCRRLTYSKEDAEDLFQETFMSVFSNMAKIGGFNSPRSFLFSTAMYIWKSWKRKFARRNRIAPVGPLDETIPGGQSTEESFIEQDETRIVRELVEALPDKYKIPTVLRYTAELTVEEIASALKLPAGTVKSRLFKARKLVEKGLTAYE